MPGLYRHEHGQGGGPSEWQHCGYHEVQSPPRRYRLIDRDRLIELTGVTCGEQLSLLHREWVEESFVAGRNARQPEWSEAVAVGSKGFVEQVKRKMAIIASGRKVGRESDVCVLREPDAAYNVHLNDKKVDLSLENAFFSMKTLENQYVSRYPLE